MQRSKYDFDLSFLLASGEFDWHYFLVVILTSFAHG